MYGAIQERIFEMGIVKVRVEFSFEGGSVTMNTSCATFSEVRRWVRATEAAIGMFAVRAITEDGRVVPLF